MNNEPKDLKKEIFLKAAEYYGLVHTPKKFIPGKSHLQYAGRVFDEEELLNLIDSSLEFWLTSGRFSGRFESGLSKYLGVDHCILVNSGSSANLLAVAALTSPLLGDRRMVPGDEVITVAAGFPTTVAPLIQHGLVPVFVDVSLPSYNIDCNHLEAAVSSRTRAVMLAHTLGNPFDIEKVKSLCRKHNFWLIEDNCDALGSLYQGELTGRLGDIATSSFYPAHHITMGEGGAVYTGDPLLAKILVSLRDWGRDCYCAPGNENTCGKRFSQEFGELPFGYDHKYVYSHFGYNLKVSDMQAAVGCAQLEKLPRFVETRKRNFDFLSNRLKHLEDRFILPVATEGADPSWFGFLLTVRDNAGFTRNEIISHLEQKRIQTRMLFAGNLLSHPCFDPIRKDGRKYRVIGQLKNTDSVMRSTFWIGVYPGLTEEMLNYMVEEIEGFLLSKKIT